MSMQVSSTDMSQILTFMQTQKQIIDSQQKVIESQRLQIEQQDKMIRKLAEDCAVISRTSIELAKKVADEEIEKFKRQHVTDLSLLKDRVKELDEHNDSLKTVAVATTAIGAVCVACVAAPYALALLL